MKLLLVVDDYLPHSTKSAAIMMHEMAVEFVSRGHQVTVLTPFTEQNKDIVVKYIDKVKILYFKTGKIKNTGRIKRAVNETLLSYRAWKASKSFLLKNCHDAIIYYSPSIFWGGFIKKIKKLWGVKSYLILRDIFPQWAVDNHIIRSKSPVFLYFKYYEYLNYKSADYIGVMSPGNLRYFEKRFKDISKFEVLYNWFNIKVNNLVKSDFRKKLNLENKVVFFYGGNIGHAQNMIYLLKLAERFLNIHDAHFLFVGSGDEVELVLKEKKRRKLQNLTYLPPVDQDTYFKMLQKFDVGLFSLHPDHKTHNFPGKLLGYMALSKPILGCVNSGNDLKEIINDNSAGFIKDSGDEEELYKAALILHKSKELRAEMGKNGSVLLREVFSVKKTCDQIESKFNTYF